MLSQVQAHLQPVAHSQYHATLHTTKKRKGIFTRTLKVFFKKSGQIYVYLKILNIIYVYLQGVNRSLFT